MNTDINRRSLGWAAVPCKLHSVDNNNIIATSFDHDMPMPAVRTIVAMANQSSWPYLKIIKPIASIKPGQTLSTHSLGDEPCPAFAFRDLL